MRFKKIMRYDSTQKKLRLGVFIWQRGAWGGGRPYSFKLTLALQPALFSFRREWDQVRMTLLGLSVNYHESAGGTFC